MATLSPFVRFADGKCREAMNFYKDILGGELQFMTAKGTPMEKDMPKEKHDLIMHSTLTLKNGGVLIGSDMMMDKLTVGDNVGLSLDCESEAELRAHFDKLAKGGDVFMAPEKQFWGGIFGV